MRFIKLYEKITEWEWYDDLPTYRVFTHLLLTANWKDTRWHGIEIKRGQRLISFRGLAEETGLSERQVRTAIEHLKSTHELTQRSTHKYTIVTVENYEKYQAKDNTTDTVSDTQTDTVPTSDIEDVEHVEVINKEKIPTVSKRKKPELPERKIIPPTVEMVRAYCEKRGNTIDPEDFCDFYGSKNWMIGKDKMTDWQCAVRTWERKRKNGYIRNQSQAGSETTGFTEEKKRRLKEWEARR